MTEVFSANRFDVEIIINDDTDDVYVPVVWNGRAMAVGGDFSEQEIDWMLNVAIANLKRVYGRDLLNTGTTLVPYQSVDNPVSVIQTPSVPVDIALAIKPVNRDVYYIADISFDADDDTYFLEPYMLPGGETSSMPIYVDGAIVDDGNIWTNEDIRSLGADMALAVSYYYGVAAEYLSDNEVDFVSQVPVPSNIVDV